MQCTAIAQIALVTFMQLDIRRNSVVDNYFDEVLDNTLHDGTRLYGDIVSIETNQYLRFFGHNQ